MATPEAPPEKMDLLVSCPCCSSISSSRLKGSQFLTLPTIETMHSVLNKPLAFTHSGNVLTKLSTLSPTCHHKGVQTRHFHVAGHGSKNRTVSVYTEKMKKAVGLWFCAEWIPCCGFILSDAAVSLSSGRAVLRPLLLEKLFSWQRACIRRELEPMCIPVRPSGRILTHARCIQNPGPRPNGQEAVPLLASPTRIYYVTWGHRSKPRTPSRHPNPH